MKIVSYNINGIRAANKLGFLNWVKEENADIYCLQEVRASQTICESILENCDYHVIYNCGQRPGYSGTVTLTRYIPDNVEFGMGKEDTEGRTISLFFDDTVIINSYVPNGTNRLDYKLDYFERLTTYVTELAKEYNVILCSDINIAHTELDVSHPKENSGRSGYLPIEREIMTKMLACGFVDAYRTIHPEGKAYSWRSYRSRQVGGDFGWKFRFDYIITNENNKDKIKSITMPNLDYSDHLPVIGEIDVNTDNLKRFIATMKNKQLTMFDKNPKI
ncbi:MAG: exodeoxyribonuclease III [Firmicutes bacterium]|nr:exodeoxyribonuclease III [Bacillota bacterium]